MREASTSNICCFQNQIPINLSLQLINYEIIIKLNNNFHFDYKIIEIRSSSSSFISFLIYFHEYFNKCLFKLNKMTLYNRIGMSGHKRLLCQSISNTSRRPLSRYGFNQNRI